MLQDRMGKTVNQRKALEAGGSDDCVICVAKRSALSYIGTQRRQTGSDRR
jgi:hypothetical protein